MFYLHISNQTEKLLEHLAAVIEAGGRPSLFEKELFLVQSQGMERMISQSLADHFQSWCNFSYLLPVGFLREISSLLQRDVDTEGFDRNHTTWRLDSLLRDVSEDIYQPLNAYFTGEVAELKRFQLARQLSQIFDQYQIMRPDMLRSWQAGELVTDEDAEVWQMDLWNRLVAETDQAPHRGEILATLIEMLGENDYSAIFPRRVSVVGLHIMPPLFLSFLQAVALHTDVHLYVLSPCRHYWGDVETKGRRLRRLREMVENNEDCSTLEDEESHPLLASLGRQGRDFQRMMVEQVEFQMEFASYEEIFDEEQPTLLHLLHRDLLEGKCDGDIKITSDESLRIVSCHSPLRELAVLKDHILDMLYKNEDLNLRDIVVMAPDIQEYSSLIPAVFSDIQHSIADRALRRRNTAMSVFLTYLKIFSGRMGWSEVLDLLRSEYIYPQFNLVESDFDFLQKWIIDSGIRWGGDEQQRAALGLPIFSENSWSAGIKRLLLGFAMMDDESVDGILPYTDIEGGSALALGGLCEFIDLLEIRDRAFKQSQPLAKWAMCLQADAEALFGDGEDGNLQELQNVLSGLTDGGAVHTEPVSFQVILAWLEQAATESRSSSGFLRGQLTFCSMLPMRSIPFRVVCLLGLNEQSFPKRDTHITFDLLGSMPRLGDRSPRVDDRYQFLEALISARDCLYLSYVGRSILSNEELPPSVVVSELLDMLEMYYGIQKGDVVVEHPLHPFSPRYFAAGSKQTMFSYNKDCAHIAGILQDKTVGHREKWWSGRLGHQVTQIKFADLIQFYKNPQQWFIRKIIGVSLNVSDELPGEAESFSSVGLDRYLIEQELVGALLAGKDVATLARKLVIEGRWPLAHPGSLLFDKVIEDLDEFVAKIRTIDMGVRLEPLAVDLRISVFHVQGALDMFDRGQLLYRHAKCKGKDFFEAWLCHLVATTVLNRDLETWIICKDTIGVFRGCPPPGLLEKYLAHFVDGSTALSLFHVESAYAYGICEKNAKSKVTPLQAAKNCFAKIVADGYDPELLLAIQGREESFIDPEFEELCVELVAPIWEFFHEH